MALSHLATVFIYIFTCNLIGLDSRIFSSHCKHEHNTFMCDHCVVIFTHVIGIKYHGVKYIKHFLGPVWWMVP